MVVFALGIGTMFVVLYAATLTAEPGRAHGDIIPTEPKISQLEAIELVENHILLKTEGIQKIRLYFSLYNYTANTTTNTTVDYWNSPHYDRRTGWDLGHVKDNPELLNLPLFFVHRNGTVYGIDSIDSSYMKACDLSSPESAPLCPMGRIGANAARDRLVYSLVTNWSPAISTEPHTEGHHIIDAETGEVVWNNIDYARERKPIPNIHYDNRTIRQLFEDSLDPRWPNAVSIVRGSQVESYGEGYLPVNLVVTLGLDNKITWTNGDLVAHTVVSDNGYSNEHTGKFESSIIYPNDTYEYIFIEAGEYPYHCDLHPWMKGTVEVLEGFS